MADAGLEVGTDVDPERVGVVVGSGAGGYADLLGWGATTDAYRPTTPRPDGSGAAGAMRRAVADAGADLADIGYINAHGTSTALGDLAEAKAIQQLFDGHAPAVSSTKSMTGHMLGASGAVEAAITALALAHGALPPTANLDEVDPACDADHVRHTARPWQPSASGPGSLALSNSFAFGGHNVALAFGPASTRRNRTAGEGAADV
jgi:3-oxoacyl-[acyl-carrier-protein] synthase II